MRLDIYRSALATDRRVRTKVALLEIYMPLGLWIPPDTPAYVVYLTAFSLVGGRILLSTPLVLNSCISLQQITLTLTSLWRPTTTNDDLSVVSNVLKPIPYYIQPHLRHSATGHERVAGRRSGLVYDGYHVIPPRPEIR